MTNSQEPTIFEYVNENFELDEKEIKASFRGKGPHRSLCW
jgi:hypothetical protein